PARPPRPLGGAPVSAGAERRRLPPASSTWRRRAASGFCRSKTKTRVERSAVAKTRPLPPAGAPRAGLDRGRPPVGLVPARAHRVGPQDLPVVPRGRVGVDDRDEVCVLSVEVAGPDEQVRLAGGKRGSRGGGARGGGGGG